MASSCGGESVKVLRLLDVVVVVVVLGTDSEKPRYNSCTSTTPKMNTNVRIQRRERTALGLVASGVAVRGTMVIDPATSIRYVTTPCKKIQQQSRYSHFHTRDCQCSLTSDKNSLVTFGIPIAKVQCASETVSRVSQAFCAHQIVSTTDFQSLAPGPMGQYAIFRFRTRKKRPATSDC